MSILPNHATLDTGGWLTLSRQGLAPCKMHQASLGALTLELCGAFVFASAPVIGYAEIIYQRIQYLGDKRGIFLFVH